MATTTDNREEYSNSDFLTVLERQPQLYDLHTHLLGMGNVGFWIDTILNDQKIMPTNDQFDQNPKVRRDLCRLIWNKSEKPGFVNGEAAAQFIEYLIEKDVRPWNTLEEKNQIKQVIRTRFANFSSSFWDLFTDENLNDEKLNNELCHRGLTFKADFSYDVVLALRDLAKGLGIRDTDDDDIAQMKIADKLGIYLSADTKSIQFRHRIVFNARIQKFEVVYGILVEDLRKLITIDVNAPNEAKTIARAHIINAFSMCDAQGTAARHVDFHSFRGAFTPEFYPRRFALKDSIYSQRLDVLAALVSHVLKRYQVCLPPVKYCEFSVGVGDLSRAWVFDVLCSFPSDQYLAAVKERSGPSHDTSAVARESSSGTRIQGDTQGQEASLVVAKDGLLHNDSECCPVDMPPNNTYIATEEFSSFSQCVRKNHFPYLEVACRASCKQNNIVPLTPNITYKFLAGFERTHVQSPLPTNQNDALRFLNDSPQLAILYMLKEIKNSQDSVEKSDLFEKSVKKLTQLKKTAKNITWFYDWVVGIDLFGDELGYPYCPFVAYPFIKYIEGIRDGKQNDETEEAGKKYPHFGVRVHGGENVQYADDDTPAYRSFIAHMYIIFCCLRYLRSKLDYGIRIGHGIAFERILGDSMGMHRKSSVLRAEMRHQASELFANIAFEVNITSNEYLLGDNLRQGNYAQTHCLDELLKLKAPVILATDDDGIWPIDRCSSVHPGHHSLAAEYCRAISSSLFKKPDDVQKMLDNSKNFCFFNMKGSLPSKPYVLPKDSGSINTIILHPDIVKHMIRRLKETHRLKKIEELLKELGLYNQRENLQLNEEISRRLEKIDQLKKQRQLEEGKNSSIERS